MTARGSSNRRRTPHAWRKLAHPPDPHAHEITLPASNVVEQRPARRPSPLRRARPTRLGGAPSAHRRRTRQEQAPAFGRASLHSPVRSPFPNETPGQTNEQLHTQTRPPRYSAACRSRSGRAAASQRAARRRGRSFECTMCPVRGSGSRTPPSTGDRWAAPSH